MEVLKRASLVPEMPDQYARNPSITSLAGFQSFYPEDDDDAMNELAERLLTDGTKVCRTYLTEKTRVNSVATLCLFFCL